MNKNTAPIRFSILALALGVLASCGGNGVSSYPIAVTVKGLQGTMVLTDGKGSPLSVGSDGQSSFSSDLPSGSHYTVSVQTQPEDQTCIVNNASGTVQSTSITVSVTCTTTGTATSLDPSLPDSLAAAITQVVTPFGSASLGTTVPVDLSGAAGVTIAVGFDAQNQIRVAALVNSPQTQFTADSTALALARLASADVDSNQSESTVESEIRASASYTSLVAAIQADLQAGTVPLSDSTVIKDLAAMLADAVPNIATSIKRTSYKALAMPKVSALPSTIVSGPKFLSGFQIVSTNNQKLGLVNGTLLPWDVSTSLSTATTLMPSEAPLTYIPMANSPFNLTISQDAAAKAQLAQESAIDAAKSLLLFMPSSCTNAAIGQVIGAAEASISAQSFQEFLTDWKASLSKIDMGALIMECAPTAAKSAVSDDAELLLEATGSMLVDLSDVSEAVGAASAGVQLISASLYWGQSFTVGLCATYNYQIQSCAASFTASPATLTMAPGAAEVVNYAPSAPSNPSVSDVTFSALDSNGNPTAIPADLQCQSDSGAVSVTPLDCGSSNPPGFTVTAVSETAGVPATISITDPSTGANKDPLTVSVITPVITPATQTVTAGTQQTVSFTLTDGSGNPIILPSGVTWTPIAGGTTSFDSSTLQPISTTGATGSWIATSQLQPGTIDIAAYGPNGTTYGTAQIDITATATRSKFQYTGEPLTVTTFGSPGPNPAPDPLAPGPVVATVSLSSAIPSNFTGTVCSDPSETSNCSSSYTISNVTIGAVGVGTFSFTVTPPYFCGNGGWLTFSNGSIVGWYVSYDDCATLPTEVITQDAPGDSLPADDLGALQCNYTGAANPACVAAGETTTPGVWTP